VKFLTIHATIAVSSLLEPTTMEEDWFKIESRKLLPDEPGSPLETDVIATWRRTSPQMAARLEAAGALEAAAHVLVDRMLKAERVYEAAGMPPTDAREQAEQEWLMLEPESDADPLD
jgi:hypothetical protein